MFVHQFKSTLSTKQFSPVLKKTRATGFSESSPSHSMSPRSTRRSLSQKTPRSPRTDKTQPMSATPTVTAAFTSVATTLKLRATDNSFHSRFLPFLAKSPRTVPTHLTPLCTTSTSTRSFPSSFIQKLGAKTQRSGFLKASKGLSNNVERKKRFFPNGNVYEGELVSGAMFGKGKYKWADAQYIGEFYNDYMCGEGVKTWFDGGELKQTSQYSGQWINDAMSGEGELTRADGTIYSGQFQCDMFHGYGSLEQFENGVKTAYVGQFVKGEREGRGVFTIEGKCSYDGQWRLGKMSGEGTMVWSSGTAYTGQWRDGIRENGGKLVWADGSWYVGQFHNNQIEGCGKKVLQDGSSFEGNFLKGQLEGHGTFRWPDGSEFEGLWHRSQIVGPGCHRFANGTSITGVFNQGHPGATGQGEKRWGGCVYRGRLMYNKMHHFGCIQWEDDRMYVGHLEDEMLEGKGVMTWTEQGNAENDGEKAIQKHVKYEGNFSRNVFHGEGVLSWTDAHKEVVATYAGQFENGLYEGVGTMTLPNAKYTGQWKKGLFGGTGHWVYPHGEYSGEFIDGHMHGDGRIEFPCGDTYVGCFEFSAFSGIGHFRFSHGASLSGSFKNNQLHGVGKISNNGIVYVGEIQNDLQHGKGVFSDGKVRLVGLWQNGKLTRELVECYFPYHEFPSPGNADNEGSASVFQGWIRHHGILRNAVGAGRWEESPRAPEASPASGLHHADAHAAHALVVSDERLSKGHGPAAETLGCSIGSDASTRMQRKKNIQDRYDSWQSSDCPTTLLAPFEAYGANANSTKRGSSTALRYPSVGPSDEKAPRRYVSNEFRQNMNGKAILVFSSGDTYVGSLRDGKKHGQGMYIYANLSAFKGEWENDTLDSVLHPRRNPPEEVAWLQQLNYKHQEKVIEFIRFVNTQEYHNVVKPTFVNESKATDESQTTNVTDMSHTQGAVEETPRKNTADNL